MGQFQQRAISMIKKLTEHGGKTERVQFLFKKWYKGDLVGEGSVTGQVKM